VEIGQLLHRLAREKSLSVLITSHDLNIAGMFADRLMLFHEGRMIAGGKPEQVLDPMILGRAYGIPMQRIANPAGPPLAVPVLPQAQAR
jgi:iron complex transport system ATP-binding protein